MKKLFTPSQAAHWYYPDGKPCHQVEMKSSPGKMRSTNVGDARKMGLLPSVTSIIRILERPQLTAWKQEQAVLASLTLPRNPGENDTDFAERVVKDAESIVETAANRGSLIHAAIEAYLVTGEKNPDPSVAALVEPFYEWSNKNITKVFSCERTVISEKLGFAGRLDLHAEFTGMGPRYADFKSRKPYDGKIRTYPEDAYQLSAYRLADQGSAGCLSVFINSSNPDTPSVHDWDSVELFEAEVVFKHCLEIWKIIKNYNPSK